ncbi:MAG: hypothetical protein OKBPIBMD_01690 [Chlorobi bacterium]|nr:hypothetical protein [Chlorobiota bacterium]
MLDDVRKLVDNKEARFADGNLEKLNNQTPNKGAPCGSNIRTLNVLRQLKH